MFGGERTDLSDLICCICAVGREVADEKSEDVGTTLREMKRGFRLTRSVSIKFRFRR